MPNSDPRLQRLLMLKAIFEQNPETFVEKTEDPSSTDYALIGKVVQFYCFADFNGRRIIDLLRHAAIGSDARNASRLQIGRAHV